MSNFFQPTVSPVHFLPMNKPMSSKILNSAKLVRCLTTVNLIFNPYQYIMADNLDIVKLKSLLINSLKARGYIEPPILDTWFEV